MREMNDAFKSHAIHVEKGDGKSKSYKWTCKYCGKSYSSVTRLLQHVGKVGGQVAPCKEVPQQISEEVFKKIRGPSVDTSRDTKAFDEVVSPPEDTVSSPHNAGHATSFSASASVSGNASASSKRQRFVSPTSSKQPTLAQATGGVMGPTSHLKERQHRAEEEIACTIIECNLSFNVLKVPRWEAMVKAIANVGPCDDWTGISYHNMRTKRIDEKRERIDRSLDPIRRGWAKYECIILSDGWTDRRKRGIINILVSCPLGTYFTFYGRWMPERPAKKQWERSYISPSRKPFFM